MKPATKQCWFAIVVFGLILTGKAVKLFQAIQQDHTNEIYWNAFFLLFAAGVIVYNGVQLRKLRRAAP